MDARLTLQNLKRLEKLIYNTRPVREINTLNTEQREIITSVRDNVSRARVQVEFSLGDEDIAAQRRGFQLAVEQLQSVNDGLLSASTYDLFDTVDVSQLSAMAVMCINQIEDIIRL